MLLKHLAQGPGLASIKCTSAAAPAQQQTVDCSLGLKEYIT